MIRYCLALDLVDDPELIHEYELYHIDTPSEIKSSIIESGICLMEIYRTGNRLFMIIEAKDDFSFELKAEMDKSNPKVQEWETLMWKFQWPLPWANAGEKWVLMNKIYKL